MRLHGIETGMTVNDDMSNSSAASGRHHGPRFTISLKRSTQNLQLSTSWPADYPISYVEICNVEIAWCPPGRSGFRLKTRFGLPILHRASIEEQFFFFIV